MSGNGTNPLICKFCRLNMRDNGIAALLGTNLGVSRCGEHGGAYICPVCLQCNGQPMTRQNKAQAEKMRKLYETHIKPAVARMKRGRTGNDKG